MKVVVFGATGMVGQGVLRECLRAPDVERVLAVVRTPTSQHHPKLRELVHRDFLDFTAASDELADYDACFYCLGVSSTGVDEADYTRVTYDFTMAAADTLARVSPKLTFIFVSGQGTDATEQGRRMWARVKGRTENAVLARFTDAYAFRPGFIQPVHGAVSRTRLYRILYAVTAPLTPLLRRLFPGSIITTEQLGQAMLRTARQGAPKRVLETSDLVALAAGPQ